MATTATAAQPLTPEAVGGVAVKLTRSTIQSQRVAAHTHIKGLGLSADGTAEHVHMGMVGQVEAREAAGIVVDLVKLKSLAGRGVLLAGPPGTGKTAIALAISQELGPNVPFCPMVASEVFSQEVKKTEVLTENFRRSIGLRIRETKEVYEGEVIELTAEETENPLGGYGKAVAAVVITLRTVKGSKTLRLAPSVHKEIQREKVRTGDVVFIEAASGSVKRVGRADSHAADFDLELDEFVPVPKGDVFKQKELVHTLTLHDLDVSNAQPQGGKDIISLMNQFLKPRKTEITERLRSEVNKSVHDYIQRVTLPKIQILASGVAELIPGVLFIDEAHMLDIECFSFLNRAIESALAPVIVLATNRGVCKVRGTEVLSPHGMPADFMDRLLIVQTKPYSLEEMLKVISLRGETEAVPLESSALQLLGSIAAKTSLRYAIQLLTPALTLAQAAGRSVVHTTDVQDADALFLDARSSVLRLKEQERSFLS